jgi:hypothetical protein
VLFRSGRAYPETFEAEAYAVTPMWTDGSPPPREACDAIGATWIGRMDLEDPAFFTGDELAYARLTALGPDAESASLEQAVTETALADPHGAIVVHAFGATIADLAVGLSLIAAFRRRGRHVASAFGIHAPNTAIAQEMGDDYPGEEALRFVAETCRELGASTRIYAVRGDDKETFARQHAAQHTLLLDDEEDEDEDDED